MNESNNLAERILTLESLSERGDAESLSELYTAMNEQELMSTNELESMIARNWMYRYNGSGKTILNAATLALGNVLASQVQQGNAIKPKSINYLKWSASDENFAYAARSLCKIMESKVRFGNSSDEKTPEWDFLQSLVDIHRKNKSIMSDLASTEIAAIHTGVTSICRTCKLQNLPVPESFQGFLTEKAAAQEGYSDPSSSQNIDLPALEEALKNRSDSESDEERDVEKEEAFRSLSSAYVEKIKRGELSSKEWRDAVFQKEIAPRAGCYRQTPETLKSWYQDQDAEPKIAAANAKLVAGFDAKYRAMTPRFENWLRSSDGLRNPLLSKAFHESFTSDANLDEPISWEKDIPKPTLALIDDRDDSSNQDLFHRGKHNMTVLTQTPFLGTERSRSMKESKWLNEMLFSDLSNITDVNSMMRRSPVFQETIGNTGMVIDGIMSVGDGEDLYHVFDPAGNIPVNYFHCNDYKFTSPWYSGMQAAPHAIESEYIDNKCLSTAILAQNGVEVPPHVSFISAQDPMSSAARALLQELSDKGISKSYPLEGLSNKDIAAIAEDVFSHKAGQHDMQDVVLKTADGSLGKEVWMLRANGIATFPEFVAGRIRSAESEGQSLVLQKEIETANPSENIGKPKACVLRVLISRDKNGEPVVSGMYAAVAESSKPVNVNTGAKREFYENWIKSLHKQPPYSNINSLETEIHEICIAADKAFQKKKIISQDPARKRINNEFSLLSADIMVYERDNTLIPTIIETNGLNSGGVSDIHILSSGLDDSDPLVKKYDRGRTTAHMLAAYIVHQVRQRDYLRDDFHDSHSLPSPVDHSAVNPADLQTFSESLEGAAPSAERSVPSNQGIAVRSVLAPAQPLRQESISPASADTLADVIQTLSQEAQATLRPTDFQPSSSRQGESDQIEPALRPAVDPLGQSAGTQAAKLAPLAGGGVPSSSKRHAILDGAKNCPKKAAAGLKDIIFCRRK